MTIMIEMIIIRQIINMIMMITRIMTSTTKLLY